MQALEASLAYSDCSNCNQEHELLELQEAFNEGVNTLRMCFDDNMRKLAELFRQKVSNQ